MKKIIFLVSFLTISFSIIAQDQAPFIRKGRVLIETGYGVIGGYSSGTGVSLINIESPITTIGADAGYFISENFALKLKISLLTASNTGISSLAIGGKYYIAGKVPVDLSLGTISIADENTLFSSFSVGYGIQLAPNINLEPGVGIILGLNGDGDMNFKLGFAMFL